MRNNTATRKTVRAALLGGLFSRRSSLRGGLGDCGRVPQALAEMQASRLQRAVAPELFPAKEQQPHLSPAAAPPIPPRDQFDVVNGAPLDNLHGAAAFISSPTHTAEMLDDLQFGDAEGMHTAAVHIQRAFRLHSRTLAVRRRLQTQEALSKLGYQGKSGRQGWAAMLRPAKHVTKLRQEMRMNVETPEALAGSAGADIAALGLDKAKTQALLHQTRRSLRQRYGVRHSSAVSMTSHGSFASVQGSELAAHRAQATAEARARRESFILGKSHPPWLTQPSQLSGRGAAAPSV